MAVAKTPGDSAPKQARTIAAVLIFMAILFGLAALLGTTPEPGDPGEVAEVISIERTQQFVKADTRYTYRLSGTTDGTEYVVDFETTQRLDIGESVGVTIQSDNQTIQLRGPQRTEQNSTTDVAWWISGASLVAALVTLAVGGRILEGRYMRAIGKAESHETESHKSVRPLQIWRIALVAAMTFGAPLLAAQLREWAHGPAVRASIVDFEVLGARSGVDVKFETVDERQYEANVPYLAYIAEPASMNILPDTDPLVVQHGYVQGNDRLWTACGLVLGLLLASSLPRKLYLRLRPQDQPQDLHPLLS